jgi:hypothetical protein
MVVKPTTAVLPDVVAVLDRRVSRLLSGLDEAVRAERDQELPILGGTRLRIGLALRVQVPGVVAVDEVRGAHLALKRHEAAAARRVVALNSDMLLFRGFAGVVDGRDITLEVSSRPIRAGSFGGETLTHRAQPAGAGIHDGIHGIRADRLVGGLQQACGILRCRRSGHHGRAQQQHSQFVFHAVFSFENPERLPNRPMKS